MRTKRLIATCCALVAGSMSVASAQQAGGTTQQKRLMEDLDRGVVAINQGEGKAYVNWRLLATDTPKTAFDVFRQVNDGQAIKLNKEPVTKTTDFVDTSGSIVAGTRYFVQPIGGQRSESFTVSVDPKPYLSIKLDPIAGHHAGDCSVADLDGDGQYEIIVKWEANNGQDNSRPGKTDSVFLDAYKLNGTKLWRIDLGKNIRAGAHYTQFMVYDLDGDGRAEVVCKTADGTVDGKGKVIGDATKDWRNEGGHILAGPEFLTCFSGPTGEAISTIPYVPSRHPTKRDPSPEEYKAIWGDNYGNRGERYLAAVAYLDGRKPSVVMCRGYYTRTVLAAFDLVDGKLKQRWVFDSKDMDDKWSHQGNHNLSVADVDGDGKDEIMYGAMCIDDNGKGLYTTGMGHGDAAHLSDMDPSRPGLENWSCFETPPFGAALRDAKTGQVIFRWNGPKDTGRACAGDIDPRHPGYELWASNGCPLFNIKGEVLQQQHRLPINFMIYWDGDDLREFLDGTMVSKYRWETNTVEPVLNGRDFGCASNNGTKANPCLSGDILGDWREEVIWRTEDSSELRIFTTTIPAQRRLVTLMQDPEYRLSITWQNVAYNQPPHPSFFIGDGMKEPAWPHIEVVPRPQAAGQ